MRSFIKFLILSTFLTAVGVAAGKETAPLNPTAPDRLPAQFEGQTIAPDLGCFWSPKLEGDECKKHIDAVAPYGAFDVLTLTVRSHNTILDNQTLHDVAKKTVEYARDRYGVKTILDIDLRIARYDFEKERPDLAQERLMFKEAAPADGDKIVVGFNCPKLTDHYTGNLPYYVRGGRLVRAWAYAKDAAGEIIPDTIIDVTEKAEWDKEQYVVENKPGYEVDETANYDKFVSFDSSVLTTERPYLTCAVAFRYSYPDLFADETLELERKIYEQYRDVPAIGVAKDEWGFPPHFVRADNLDDYWYSERMRAAYAKRFENRDLVDDLFLAFRARQNQRDERVAAVDRFRRLCGDRVVEYEFQNYALTKECWGKDAFVGVHCTWYPWPNVLEMRKDGVMWWKAPRDFAQTDEYAPFCARNSMAKGTDSLWINMFYDRQIPRYIWEHWTAAASGGRVHIHQIYPHDENSPTNSLDYKHLPIIADGGVAKIRQKIRMLNFISNSQVDSSVAVVFSRFGASNPLRPEYKHVGWELCDRFATQGFPADLIPVDEITSTKPDGTSRWSVQDGYVRYGKQKYQYIVLNGGVSDAEKDSYDALFKLAENTKTKIVSVAPDVSNEQLAELIEKTISSLKESGVVAQTPWVCDDYKFDNAVEISSRPARKCVSRFIDGTILWISAAENDFGDPIVMNEETIQLRDGKESPKISVAANGVFAAKFDDARLTAIAATELKSLNIGDVSIQLSGESIDSDPVDIALLRDENGEWKGVFQRYANDLPKELEQITSNWLYLQRR